ncbi:hypothetical protein KAJ89_03285 [Candidatus Parcubacteria bacterium]|nr:hypothetical protein [Candidatus Parcubacteria bacterium]
MAETTTADDQELNEDGTPIKPEGEGEGGEKPPKKIEKEADTEGEDDEEDEEEEGKEKDEDTDEPEIPVRRSAAHHIIKRKTETIKKLRKKDDDEEEGGEEEEEEETGESVAEEVKKQIDPIVKSLGAKADQDELNELLVSEPTAKKYEKRIRAFMKHESWSQVPPLAIYRHLAFGDAQAIGAEKKKIADTEAGHTKSGGRSIRPKKTGTGDVPSVEELDSMDDAEFEKLQHKARTGKFLKKDQ